MSSMFSGGAELSLWAAFEADQSQRDLSGCSAGLRWLLLCHCLGSSRASGLSGSSGCASSAS